MTDLSNLLVSAAEGADQSLVHVSAHCRRGATGSVFGDDGLILTTARALGGRERLEIVRGNDSVEARVVGVDVTTDIGVLRAESPLGKAAKFRDNPAPQGTLVLVGSRPGRTARVRLGLLSETGPAWHTPRGGRVERYLELDTAPEPGFSGGLVLDAAGLALGMTSAGLLRGTPLVLEKPTLDRVVGELVAHGRVRRGYLGVGTQAVALPEALAQTRAQRFGLLVASVQAGSAAERAGVLLGDVLLALGESRLGGAGALQAALEDAEGQTLALSIWRAGQELSFEVTPGARP